MCDRDKRAIPFWLRRRTTPYSRVKRCSAVHSPHFWASCVPAPNATTGVMFVRSPPNGKMWLGQDSGDRCGDASDRPPMRQILGKGGLMATQVRHNRMPATVDHTYRMKWEARQVDEWMGISM